MKHRTNPGKLLRHAILLSLAVSAVWGTTAMAADAESGIGWSTFIQGKKPGDTITVAENTIVNSAYAGNPGIGGPKEIIGDYKIELDKDAALNLNNLNMYNTHITGTDDGYGGNITVTIDTRYTWSEDVRRPGTNGKDDDGSDPAYGYGGGLIVKEGKTIIKANDLTITNSTPNEIYGTKLDDGAKIEWNNRWYASGIFVGSGESKPGATSENPDMDIDLTGRLSVSANYHGITTETNTQSALKFKADSVSVNAGGWGVFINGKSQLDMTAEHDIEIQGGQGISNNSPETLNFTSTDGDISVQAETLYAVTAEQGDINLKGKANSITVVDNSSNISNGYEGYAVRSKEGNVYVEATEGNNTLTGTEYASGIFSRTSDETGVTIKAKQNNIIKVDLDGAYAKQGYISLNAENGDNTITAGRFGLKAEVAGKESSVTAEAYHKNSVTAGQTAAVNYGGQEITFGDSKAVYAYTGGQVFVKAGTDNVLSGAVYASGNKSEVKSAISLGGLTGEAGTETTNPDNFIYSAAVVADNSAEEGGKKVISAVYADDSADITVKGKQNTILSYVNPDDSSGKAERTVWASKGSSIGITGQTIIAAYGNEKVGDGNGIAVASGMDKITDGNTAYDMDDDQRSHVNVAYSGSSFITGDVVSGYGGAVSISANSAAELADTGAASMPSLTLKGNVLAANGGNLTVDLGNGGTLTGRIDDYQDADEKNGNTFYNPQFSNTINKKGTVILNMGTNSYWDVTGQSWVTSLSGNNGVIDMRNTADGNHSSHAVHINTISGNHTFVMDLNDDNHTVSDMLYINDVDNSSGTQTVFLNSLKGVEDMADGDKLRFATVNAGTGKLNFVGQYNGENGYAKPSGRVMIRDEGLKDMALEIGSEKYNPEDTENPGYNGTETVDETKPGDAYIDQQYGKGTNWFLTRQSKDDELSDAGQTIVSMARANYSNAVYMDRLNKRMGEARYIEGDDGLWVRLRHDRIGRENAFRSMNTMMELGYDRKVQAQKDGEHRRGVAFDYMRGKTSYRNVMGDGDVHRAGVWLYDTWLGDKGHYTDYVLKYGHLSNDFDIFASAKAGTISGDYDNNVWSASAEYGRKKDIGSDWYFEPQAQMQYAYVTSADYMTSQGTKVKLDGIDSLIGRAGFRLGRDTSEGNTVYFKADILHEFLGDQKVHAADKTGVLDTTYENEGTWYDVGFGFSHRMGKDSYMFLDLEHSFGNDNDETYQINIGLSKAF